MQHLVLQRLFRPSSSSEELNSQSPVRELQVTSPFINSLLTEGPARSYIPPSDAQTKKSQSSNQPTESLNRIQNESLYVVFQSALVFCLLNTKLSLG